MDRAKSQTNKNIETVLLGHNSSIFDTPVLLRNSGTHFTERLQKMDICFADSLTLFKTLIKKKKKMPSLQNSDGTFPRATLKPGIRNPESQVVVLPIQRVKTILNIHKS